MAPERSDRGDTLVEILIAVIVIAIAVGPLLGTLIESLASSAEQRGLAVMDTLLKSFAETAKSGIELSPPAGKGSISGTTATSSALFVGSNTFKGDHLIGTGIPPTVSITAENNSTHTATLSSSVTTESTETLTVELFQRCATSYRILSRPSKLAGPVGTVVTIFGTGFGHGIPLGSFGVKVGGVAVPSSTVLANQSRISSDGYGNMEVTFKIPTGMTASASPQVIALSGPSQTSSPMSVSSFSGDGFTVTTGTPTTRRSPDATDSLGIVGIKYWNLSTGAFGSACTPNVSSGIQQITLSGTTPTGGKQRLSFVLRDPSFFAPPVPTPTVLVTGKNVALPYSGGPAENLVFTAAVTAPVTNPPPTGTVSWKLTTPTGSGHPACTTHAQMVPTGTKTLVATCKLTLATTSHVGLYTAVATYPGDAYTKQASGSGTATVFAPDGSGAMSVMPTAVFTSSVSTLTFKYTPASGGTGNGQVNVAVPAGWSAPQTSTSSLAGFVTASGGTGSDALTITGRTVEISGVSLTATAGQMLTVIISGAVAPSNRGRYTFTAKEFSTAGGTLTALKTSPTVVVAPPDKVITGKTATGGKSITTTTFTVTSGQTYLVYAFSSASGIGDKVTSIKSTGFSSALKFTQVGTQEKFHATKDNAWVWVTKATGGSGTITINLHNTIQHAFLEVVQLVGAGTPAVVTGSKGFNVASAAGTLAKATLSKTPSSANPEVIFLAAEGNLGTTQPPLPGFVTGTGGFAHSAAGSFAVYTGLATKTESITIQSNWWGTVALEING